MSTSFDSGRKSCIVLMLIVLPSQILMVGNPAELLEREVPKTV
jgi:hypothetical protein